jgi:hypothetical protein
MAEATYRAAAALATGPGSPCGHFGHNILLFLAALVSDGELDEELARQLWYAHEHYDDQL